MIKLAENGDNVNDIQRQILERLDSRVVDLEMRDSKTLEEYNSVSHRLLQAEIKTEKLIATAEDITSQFMIIKKTSEKHSVIAENNKTLELLLAKTRAETEASISKQELMLEDFEKRFRRIELSNEENNEKFEKV